MTDKGKEQKALGIYQQLGDTLEDVSGKTDIINIVNTLIEENGLCPSGEPKASLKTSRKKPESGLDAMPCPKCGSEHVVKNGSAHGKSRFLCNGCGAFFGPTSGRLIEGTSSSDKTGDVFVAANLGIDKDYSAVMPDYRKYGFRNYPHGRGSQDSKRGLEHAFSSRLDRQSILATDKSKGGIKHAESTGLAHFALDSKTEVRKGQYNLQLVNYLHSIIAEILHSGS